MPQQTKGEKRMHTPGEWSVAQSDHAAETFVRESTPYSEGRRMAVARVTKTGRTPSEIEANARLIAAAPTMADLLERINAIYRANSARMAPMIAGNDQMEPLMVEVSALLAARQDGETQKEMT